MRAAHRYTEDAGRRVEGLTRTQICHEFAPKVQLIARRIAERLSTESSVQIEDLVSCGAIGLLEAFERFDPSRGIRFTTYAEYRIRGAMYDALRDNDTFSRRHRQLARRIQQATEDLRQAHEREPTAEEVAERLGIGLDDYWAAANRVKPVSHVSLDSSPEEGGVPLLERLLASDEAAPDLGLRVDEIRRALREAIEALPERQRHCVMMYYGKGMTLAEISRVYDVTVSRVSQILSEARGRLARKLKPLLDAEDLELELSE